MLSVPAGAGRGSCGSAAEIASAPLPVRADLGGAAGIHFSGPGCQVDSEGGSAGEVRGVPWQGTGTGAAGG